MSVAQPAIRKYVYAPVRWAIGIALPPRCLGCGLVVDQDDSLCTGCWATLTFAGTPRCAACGIPFEIPADEEALCAPCLDQRPSFSEARAAVVYDPLPRTMLMRFKYGGKPHLARMMARHIRLVAPEWLDDENALLIPVPLARWRLWRRGYNQAGLIAQALARLSAAQTLPGGLVRHRATRSSGGLSRRQRFENVRGAFRVADGAKGKIKGKSVILVVSKWDLVQ